MPVWNIRASHGAGTVTESKNCLPGAEEMKRMYEAGCRMYKDGIKLSLAEALEELPKEDMPAGKKKSR